MEQNAAIRARIALGLISGAFLLVGSACKPQGASTALDTSHPLPAEAQIAALPLGEIAGAAKLPAVDEVANPLGSNASVIEDGHRLFIAMNCAGCHGYDAKGGMGPNLTDAYWRYGGMPSNIYNSIYEGRPQGMPAWGRVLPAQDIWKLVAFVQSLGGAVAWNQYHRGLQGDHDVTSTAPEANSLVGVFNNLSAGTSLTGEDGRASSAASSAPHEP
jgi:mono/diheme cytochrome c family protein